VLNAFVSDVVAACLGPLTAKPLLDLGAQPLVAPGAYAEDLTALFAQNLPQRALRLEFGRVQVEVRGQALASSHPVSVVSRRRAKEFGPPSEPEPAVVRQPAESL
jgi:hypothetical protein